MSFLSFQYTQKDRKDRKDTSKAKRMIQSHTIQAVKEVPVMDVIGQYVNLRRRGATYKGLCPFHDERTASFYVHPAKNIFKCFGCGASGDGIKFIMDYERKTFVEAVELIAAITGISIERTERTQRTPPKPKKCKPQPAQFDTIPAELLDTSTPDIAQNSLTAQIGDLVGADVVQDVLQDYRITLERDGFIHYPQIDRAGQYRTGKSIQYKDGHRTSSFRWVHNWLKNSLPANFTLKQCFTGEHLINTKPVAIVEGQSTMLFMAALGKAGAKYHIEQLQYFSSFTWIATGGVDGIGWKDEQVLKALAGKSVVLFPDAGFYDTWLADAEQMQEHGIRVQVSQRIENKLQRNQDLRDWFMLFADDIRKLCRQDHLINQVFSKDMLPHGNSFRTGREFNNITLAMFYAKDGSTYDVLFDSTGEWIRPGEQQDVVQRLAAHYQKHFEAARFDDQPCLIHLCN